MYCVAVTFKMAEQVEQWVCTKFCIKLEHSAMETIWMIQKATAIGNWWLAASSWMTMYPLIHYISCRVFLGKHKITQVTQPPTAQIWCPLTSGFSQNWNYLGKGRDFRPSTRFKKICWDSWWWLGELCEVPWFLLWRRLRYHCSVYNVSCILCLLQ